MAMFKTKHRVLEKVMGDGRSRFFAQQRGSIFFFRWYNMGNQESFFRSLDEANEYILKETEEERARTEVNTKVHPFAEVFVRLARDERQKARRW